MHEGSDPTTYPINQPKSSTNCNWKKSFTESIVTAAEASSSHDSLKALDVIPHHRSDIFFSKRATLNQDNNSAYVTHFRFPTAPRWICNGARICSYRISRCLYISQIHCHMQNSMANIRGSHTKTGRIYIPLTRHCMRPSAQLLPLIPPRC